MSWRFSDGLKKRVGGGGIREICIDLFVDRSVTLKIPKAGSERSRGRGEGSFGIPLLKAQHSVLYYMHPALSPVSDLALGTTDDFVDAVLGAHNDWRLRGTAGVDEAAKPSDKRRLQHLQEFCRAKKRKFPANVS